MAASAEWIGVAMEEKYFAPAQLRARDESLSPMGFDDFIAQICECRISAQLDAGSADNGNHEIIRRD